MYHWSKNTSDPTAFVYKGLVFPLYAGTDLDKLRQNNSGKRIFAFFGSRAMTEQQIRYHVTMMIERREWVPDPQLATA